MFGKYEFAVIGLGPAGCLFLACLPDDVWPRTLVFDAGGVGGVGGDLGCRYGNVRANLTRAELAKAFWAIPRWVSEPLPLLLGDADPDTCPLLSVVCDQLREIMKPILARVTLHSQHVTSVSQIVGGWCVDYGSGSDSDSSGGSGSGDSVCVPKVVICTGGEPRVLDYSKPAIPLSVALDKVALASYIRPTDCVVVFGTAHSGTLIMRNLREAGCSGITGIYRGSTPFRWSRGHTVDCPCALLGGTGCHDSEGVKQESAAIADAIVRGEWGSATPTLISVTESEALETALNAADYVVYAVGFNGRMPALRGLGGEVLGADYNPGTGQIAPGLWGFGLAFPAMYTKPRGGEAVDVGLPGFAMHIRACIDAIKNG